MIEFPWQLIIAALMASMMAEISEDAPTQAPRHTGPSSDLVQPGDRTCATYNQGLCSSNSAHPADLHVCSYCLQYVIRSYVNTQTFTAGTRVLQKMRRGVSSN